MRALILSAVTVIALTACGGSEPPPVAPSNTAATTPAPGEAKEASTGGEHGEHGEHGKGEGHHGDGKGHEEHGKMNPALHDFHEVIAPIWHTKAGDERVAKACSGEKALRDKAVAVGDAELTASADAVKAACEKPGKSDVETKLSSVHDRFHKLAEQAKEKK
ncbi:MAG: hypothetical protein KIT84_10435 [Labilithrix sp.]|nr:hypothetical protein [Labilithrix sp.]MCW5811422.1 hypothetical protein [Labilithrix sp.]